MKEKNNMDTSRRKTRSSRHNDHFTEAGEDHVYKGKSMVEWMALFCQTVQTATNERNESDRYMREKIDGIHEEVRVQTEVMKTGFAEICQALHKRNEDLNALTGRKEQEDTFHIPMDFIDACAAMVRYAYALAEQGKGSPLHLFPCRNTQMTLIRTAISTLIEFSYDSTEFIRTLLQERENIDRGSGEDNMGVVRSDAAVEHILCCRIVRSGKDTRCVYPEIYSNNGKEKNTVLDRLLDQRRRYHESVTLPLVLAWLRFSGFVGYDGSKSLKKQNAEVFESAADALEGDEHGACAYYDGAMYGKSYQASCLALCSASETFAENALGYVKKLIVDDEKLTNTILKFESDITSSSDLNNQERNNMSTYGLGSTE